MSGACSIHEGTTPTAPAGAQTDAVLVAPGEPGLPKKYQYWAIKLKPYVETQFSIQNKIYADQIFSLDLNIDVNSFKAFAWADASIWYQYDSSNPKVNGISTNYRNYFFCTGAGVTVKPILMAVTLQLKLRNCYKVLIQSLTDWSNWSNLGTGPFLWGLLDSCKNSDAEQLTIFTWQPVPSDKNYILRGNLDNGDPSTDWNGAETNAEYLVDNMMGNKYNFDYCTWLKSGDMDLLETNPYELHNGGPNGDLYCYKTAESWRPNLLST